MRHITERTEIGAGAERILGVTIPEQRGAFLALCQQLGDFAVSEFNYRYQPGTTAKVFIGLRQTNGVAHREELSHNLAGVVSTLEAAGNQVIDLSDDELAKIHVRHLIGGPRYHQHEQVFRVEFPERPGALAQFLAALGHQFDISLFHYRNHGADYGRVLIGFAASADQQSVIMEHMYQLSYQCYPVNESAAYQFFLGSSAE